MLSQTAEHALRAMTCLAASDRYLVSADVLAETIKAPRRNLTRVLQDLAAGGLVESRSGPGGGYFLSKSTGEVTILDVIKAVSPLEESRRVRWASSRTPRSARFMRTWTERTLPQKPPSPR